MEFVIQPFVLEGGEHYQDKPNYRKPTEESFRLLYKWKFKCKSLFLGYYCYLDILCTYVSVKVIVMKEAYM